ncbi:MAG: diguanylate cyclase [Eubacterium sp.]|jgi:DNA-binding SARP family transcriptional activator|uniref:DNA-binding transcriptional activator of the SARP family n=1 Tax=Eubacterium cellulosolvens (strain ATCC 43171 / JCM 9499 / 6) TaxID=633697 RepID=I5AVZ5_EUBC6|nr:diguanylate cyclase [Eubacterium sp.]
MTIMTTEEKTYSMQVRLFGKFEITDGETLLTKDSIRSDMVTKLFAYLLSHNRMGCTIQELTDVFWPEEKSENPAGALKNLMYRLRKILNESWPGVNMLITGRGSYHWNTDIPVTIDVHEMEELIQQARDTEDESDKVMYLRQAVDLYRGKVLSDYSNEYWVMSMQAYSHSQYLQAVKALCALLEKRSMFSIMEEICLKAIDQDQLDEDLHGWLMRAYIGQNKQGLAQQHYQDTVKIIYDNLGVEPSEDLRKIYDDAMRQMHSQEADLDVVQSRLKESNDEHVGAFMCEYGVFKKIYELEARRVDRMGLSIFLSLITMDVDQKPKLHQTELEVQSAAMDQMQGVLLNCLRSGDLVTRYSSNQFLVMLQGCNYENAKRVMGRVDEHYSNMHRHVHAGIEYSFKEMEL